MFAFANCIRKQFIAVRVVMKIDYFSVIKQIFLRLRQLVRFNDIYRTTTQT